MDFDHLLREYLSGTLSDRELEEFRSLLESVPEYKTELRQTLEIRSLIQDDAMHLVPPPDLSEHIRIAVGSSFAADALMEREQTEKRRTLIPYAFRISAGAFVMACLLFGVARTPTLPGDRQPGDRQPAAVATTVAPQTPEGEDIAALAPEATAPEAPARQTPERSGRRSDRIAAPAEASQDIFWDLGHEVPYRAVSASDDEEDGGSIAQTFPVGSDNLRSPFSSEVLSHDPAEILYRNLSASAYRPMIHDSTTTSSASSVASFESQPGDIFTMEAQPGRVLAFGVTIGSGQVSETESPTALLQKSCYMSFNVSQNDRIGVEMGASSFQQNARNPNGIGGKMGVASFSSDDPGALTYTDPNALGQGGLFYGKQTAGMPSETIDGGQTKLTVRPSTQVAPPPSRTDERFEQQISYGGVFYDRRFEVSKVWDLCGRVTVGGADNAIMGNVRAYAAFSPSKNVTLTMGIGGSGLRNFSAKGSNFSANYGIYYGIETGF